MMIRKNNVESTGNHYRSLSIAAGTAGCTCPECNGEKEEIKFQYSDKSEYTKRFIEKAINRFGSEQFSFQDTNRVDNNLTKVIIHCNYCNTDFSVDPNYFLTSKFCYGCPKCNPGKSSRLTKDKFLSNLFTKFPEYREKYDFSESTDYVNISTDIENIRCLEHNKYFKGRPGNLMSGRVSCPDCIFEVKSQSKLLSSFNKAVDKITETYTNIYTWEPIIFDPTIGIRERELTFYCPTHGKFTITKERLDYLGFDTCICPDCILHNKRLSQGKIYFDKLQTVFDPEFYDCSDILTNYINEDVPFKIKCLRHGTVFEARISNALSGCCGCKQCSKRSKGERYTEKWLESHSIKYKSEEMITEISGRYGSYVKIDFTISLNGITYWIECNGEQHYKWVPRFQKTLEDYQEQLKRDINVREYCLKNNIVLIEIPYTYYRSDRLNQVLEDLLINGKSYKDVITRVPKIMKY